MSCSGDLPDGSSLHGNPALSCRCHSSAKQLSQHSPWSALLTFAPNAVYTAPSLILWLSLLYWSIIKLHKNSLFLELWNADSFVSSSKICQNSSHYSLTQNCMWLMIPRYFAYIREGKATQMANVNLLKCFSGWLEADAGRWIYTQTKRSRMCNRENARMNGEWIKCQRDCVIVNSGKRSTPANHVSVPVQKHSTVEGEGIQLKIGWTTDMPLPFVSVLVHLSTVYCISITINDMKIVQKWLLFSHIFNPHHIHINITP